MCKKTLKIILLSLIFGVVFFTSSFCRVSVETCYQRGLDYVLDQKFAKAEKEFFQGAKNEHSYECLNNLEIIKQAKQKGISEQYLLHLAKGQKFLLYSRLKDALTQFGQALKINSELPYPYYYLGSVYYKMGEPKKSEKYYKAVLKKDINFASAYFNLGVLYDSTGNSSKAKAYFQESLDLASADAESLLNLGVNLYRRGKYEQAKRYLEKAAVIFHERGYYNLQSIAERFFFKIPD